MVKKVSKYGQLLLAILLIYESRKSHIKRASPETVKLRKDVAPATSAIAGSASQELQSANDRSHILGSRGLALPLEAGK